MTRVRYQMVNGVLVSRPMLANAHSVVALIDPSTFTCTVKAEDNSTVLWTDTTTSLARAKKTVKAALASLGVVFEAELRNRLTLDEVRSEAEESFKESA